jgi:hypothetical protein
MTKGNSPKPNPALKDLEIFIGQWEMEISNAAFLPDRSTRVKGVVSFEWVEDGAFLALRMGGGPSSSPGAVWLIHRDESSSDYQAFYYDDRKVSRIYEMSFADGSWKLWRQSPEFSQRFEGRISSDGNAISAQWEKSSDGLKWKHDFDLTYTRMK